MGAKNNDSHSEKWVIVKFYTPKYRKCGNFNSKNDSRPCMGASAFLKSVDFRAFAVNVKTIAPTQKLYQSGHAIWSEETLGSSDYQMGTSGCITTCIAAMEEIAGERNPGELNQLFSQGKVYDAQGNLQWDQLEKALGVRVIKKESSITSEDIEDYLKQGVCPIARVRVKGLGNFHYVLLIGSSQKDFFCMAPLNLEEEAVALSRFGDRIYALRCIVPE